MVIEDGLSLRDVSRLEGVSSFKQVFALHIVIMFQEYTDVPIVVEFKASALTDSQSESSVAMGEVDGDEVI